MRLGNWEVTPCLAGKFKLDGGAMFGVVPKTIWSKLIPADEDNRIPMALRTLVIRGYGKAVIVDSGGGGGWDEKLEKIYQFERGEGLSGSLGALGLIPADITDVIVTHLHFDHGGGLVTPSGDGWSLTFPNAVHHVHEDQWKHALSPNPRDRASYFRERIEILERENVLAMHDAGWSLAPGLDILIVNGHTPGQQLAKVSGGGETVCYCADLIPTSAHIPIPYVMAYDLNPVLAMEEKERFLASAVAESWILCFEHDPFKEACRIAKEGRAYKAGETIML
ncbi:MAG: MBL fold metallo-hydrolase [Chitinivibrionia bacterium]|nr:MBL fold metallo-hydrolase [Chitinivibrionia bacterium]